MNFFLWLSLLKPNCNSFLMTWYNYYLVKFRSREVHFHDKGVLQRCSCVYCDVWPDPETHIPECSKMEKRPRCQMYASRWFTGALPSFGKQSKYLMPKISSNYGLKFSEKKTTKQQLIFHEALSNCKYVCIEIYKDKHIKLKKWSGILIHLHI